MSARTIRTARNLARRRLDADARAEARGRAAEVAAAGVAAVLRHHPEIGQLTRNGRPVYYVTAPVYREAAHPAELVAGGAP
jgi:hypothetical protein